MARIIRMPTEAELPKGNLRDFVEELFHLYRAANRPTLRVVSTRIDERDDPATASRETIRRMFRGQTVPTRWEIVNAVFLALCDLAELDPDADRWESGLNDESPTYREVLKELWNKALDDPSPPSLPWQSDDPWATARTTDEPPF